MSSHTKMVTVIGAGPIGIEAAVYAASAGLPVQIFEKGPVGNNMADWGHVKLFSPFSMNHSPLGRHLLGESKFPEEHSYLTGRDFLKHYLIPLSKISALKGNINAHTQVISIGKEAIRKNEMIGGPRQDFRFKILTRNKNSKEQFYYSDYVVDASGSYGNHNWLGEGGIPAIGELALKNRIIYTLRSDYRSLSGKTVLLIGDGHGAGTTLLNLKPLLEKKSTKIIWLTPQDRSTPLTSFENDSLPERAAVVISANELASHPQVQWIKSARVQAIAWNSKRKSFSVNIHANREPINISVHKIIANVGYSPDNSIYRELQVHECYASRGPMKLSAALLGESSADCLAQTSKGPDVLKNPEPNFFILGIKSYGKNSNFLIRIGLEQIRDAFKLITGNPELDLYREQVMSITA